MKLFRLTNMENKWQHFVPQFYFRLFSEDKLHVLGYHLKSKKHYRDKISNQAAKNYFYSKNSEVEKSFSHIEGKFNEVLRKISEKGILLELSNQDYLEMLRFISFQHKRTEHSKKSSEDFVDKFYENVMKPFMKSNKELMSKISAEDIDKTKLKYPAAFLMGVAYSLEANILLTDLVPILIENQTEEDFVFSDNPVVFYNLIYRDPSHPFEGIQHPALLVFCPISPKYCLLLFDPEYYGLDCGKDKTLILKSEEDLRKINKLQFHNSLGNIYYKNEINKDRVNKLSDEFFSKYSKESELTQIKEVKKWDGSTNSLVVSSGKGIPEKLNFSFLDCKEGKREVPVVRNIKLHELFNERTKDLFKKKII